MINMNKKMNNSSMVGGKSFGTRVSNGLIIAVLTLFGLISIFPFAWMLSASLKNSTEVFYYPIQWIPSPMRWENYVEILSKYNFGQYYWNTTVVTVMITLGTLLLSILAAYSFAKLKFRGSNLIFLLYISTLMLPWQVYMIPQYLMVSNVGLTDTHIGLVLTQIFAPFGVFLLKQFFMSIPGEYTEAAKIDGCNHFKICFKIIAPMSKPAIVSLVLLTFMSAWNDYLAPLIYLKQEKLRTLQIALHYFQGENETNWALLMAGTCLSLLPVLLLYIFAQKQLMDGMASAGGIKG